MNFDFVTANKIIFGEGRVTELTDIVSEFGNKALLVSGKNISRFSTIIENPQKNHHVKTFSIDKEPTIEIITEAAQLARETNPDIIIGLGGGSVIDAAKAIAAFATNTDDPLTYMEVIGDGQRLMNNPLPVIAVPTTSGTGAEVTKNAVLASKEHGVKVSLRHDKMLPSVALVDPELTYSLPPQETAYTGLDALTQLIEPYVSNKANPLTDAVCLEGIKRASRSLPIVYENGNDVEARRDMSISSLFGGLALANAKLGAVHGFAGPIGGAFPITHGLVCARLLPYVTEANIDALSESNSPEYLERYLTIAKIVTDDQDATCDDLIDWLFGLSEQFNITPLSEFGMTSDDISLLVTKAQNASSMKGNPVKLSDKVLSSILSKAISS